MDWCKGFLSLSRTSYEIFFFFLFARQSRFESFERPKIVALQHLSHREKYVPNTVSRLCVTCTCLASK